MKQEPTERAAPVRPSRNPRPAGRGGSQFNDSYFWVVTRFTGLQGTDALRGWSGITTAVWAGSIPLLFILNLILG